MVEERIAIEYPKQEIRCPTHLCIGHEAISAGVCANLTSADYVMSNHRSHGHYLGKGGDLKAFIAELYGKETGCSKGWGGSQHLVDLSVHFLGSTPIVGGTIPVAVGSALASKMKKERAITVVFFGDAATEEGAFHESLNFAVLHKLPVLFVCENNLYSIFTHISKRQPKRSITSFVSSHGMYAKKADGNNILKVYQTSKKAIEYIQKGNGPAFIEYMTYRYREHCGPNFEEKGQRDEMLFQKWMKKDPVRRFEKKLMQTKNITLKQIDNIKNEITKEIDDAFQYAKQSPYPKFKF